MLEQRQTRGCVHIEFGSKKLDECQQWWDTQERKLYAVRVFVEGWQDYFCAASFVIRTDHQNVLYLANSIEGKLPRWSLFIQQFDFKIEYLKVPRMWWQAGCPGLSYGKTLGRICW
ncbi:putative pol polyprotein [Gregarina niphandrodes]|uniref:Pol polyprotein n=1 Tax=Gregarina niphandrodes TaxID=110365 RepID=A0A023B7Y0_GRENI|nr:putative pol polyprotein [Gregarina niphandrodes]EZG67971.1 putative pol polyprotein [Gregarina niphandrodes]|eukprot:XP_011130120.1 putative pol polyprotein [Gregarina niphandrodes]